MSNLAPATTRREALALAAGALERGGIEHAKREARLLLQLALGIDAGELLARPDRAIGPGAARLADVLTRRLAHEPLTRIQGRREFFGLDFTLSAGTLDPRPDTETLVEAVLDQAEARGIAARSIRILDLGVGSGAILGALLSRLPKARGVGVDLSEEALATARGNIERLCGPGRAEFIRSDWFEGVEGAFDIIVSNPPYIPSADLAGLDPEVRLHDPALALDGGEDGLVAYRVLAGGAADRLNPDGFAAVELGFGQAGDVSEIFARAGFGVAEIRPDLAGIPRALVASPSAAFAPPESRLYSDPR